MAPFVKVQLRQQQCASPWDSTSGLCIPPAGDKQSLVLPSQCDTYRQAQALKRVNWHPWERHWRSNGTIHDAELPSKCIRAVNRKAYNQILLLCFLLLICGTAALCHSGKGKKKKKAQGFTAGRCAKHRVERMAPVHKYSASNCMVRCHHPYTAICWAIHLSSQYDHWVCSTQVPAVLKAISVRPLPGTALAMSLWPQLTEFVVY